MSKAIMIIGWTWLALGVSCANSDCLIIPIAMVSIGMLLIRFGSKENI